jgi:hypothetical protein
MGISGSLQFPPVKQVTVEEHFTAIKFFGKNSGR